jgi:hypothetical protein
VKRDATALARMLADESVSTDAEGRVRTRSQDLANVEAEGNEVESFVVDDMEVQTQPAALPSDEGTRREVPARRGGP